MGITGCEQKYSGKKSPEAINGSMDLSDWDFEKDCVVRLDGKWEFYWNELLEPSHFDGDYLPVKTGLINLPDVWNGYIVNGKKLSGNGYATFKLALKLKEYEDLKALKVVEMFTAYKLWVDNKLVAYNGVVGKIKD